MRQTRKINPKSPCPKSLKGDKNIFYNVVGHFLNSFCSSGSTFLFLLLCLIHTFEFASSVCWVLPLCLYLWKGHMSVLYRSCEILSLLTGVKCVTGGQTPSLGKANNRIMAVSLWPPQLYLLVLYLWTLKQQLTVTHIPPIPNVGGTALPLGGKSLKSACFSSKGCQHSQLCDLGYLPSFSVLVHRVRRDQHLWPSAAVGYVTKGARRAWHRHILHQ